MEALSPSHPCQGMGREGDTMEGDGRGAIGTSGVSLPKLGTDKRLSNDRIRIVSVSQSVGPTTRSQAVATR